MKKINEKGITMIALIITIIVLLIIVGIAISGGKSTIKKAKLESLKTNMMLIKAKSLECVEEVNFKLGPNNQKTEEEKTEIRENTYESNDGAKLKKLSDLNLENPGITISNEIPQDESVYWVTEDTMEKWGLNRISLSEGEVYLIKFNENEAKVEIYNTIGFEGKYSLTDINEINL